MRRILYWVFPGSLEHTLDRATWVETSKELVKLGWSVTIFCSDQNENWKNAQTTHGLKIISFPMPEVYFVGKFLFHYSVLLFLLSRLSTFSILFYTQESAVFLFPLYAFKKITRAAGPKFVLDSRTMPMSYATGKLRVRAKFYTWANKHSSILADAQTVITSRMASALEIPPEKILCAWPSGVNESFFSASRLRDWKKDYEKLRLIYVGSLARERHILELCQSVVRLRSEGRHVTLTLVGDGDLRREIETYASHPEIGITYIPPVPPDEIPDLLSVAEIGVLPFPNAIQFNVSSPIKLFEYLASGLVVLATKIPCHTDVLGETEAIWAEGADCDSLYRAILSAFQMREEFPRMSERALEIARKWTWKESAQKLSEGLDQVL